VHGTKFHLLAFTQMSVFRDLTPLELTTLAISQEPMPGLSFFLPSPPHSYLVFTSEE
jgi:hypothetical protein